MYLLLLHIPATLIMNNVIPNVIPKGLHNAKDMQFSHGDMLFLAQELSSLAKSSGQGNLYILKGRRFIGQVKFQK